MTSEASVETHLRIAVVRLGGRCVKLCPRNAVGIPGAISSGFPVPGVGVGGVGFGGSIPFEIESNMLAFTDPNAALAASNDAKSREQGSAESSSDSGSSSNRVSGLF